MSAPADTRRTDRHTARRRGRHDILGGPGVAAFPVTPAMRDYLASFDRYLTASCGPQAMAARHDMTEALARLHQRADR